MENDKLDDLLVNPPENWTWLIEFEYPICPECSNEMEQRKIEDSEDIKYVCTICGFETFK